MGAAKQRKIDARNRRQDSLRNRGVILEKSKVPEVPVLTKIEGRSVVKNPILTKKRPGRPATKNLGKGTVKGNSTKGKEKK